MTAKAPNVIARGPVARGVLSEDGAAKVQGFLDHAPETLEGARAALHALETPARTIAQLALRYALSHPAVATVVPGASTVGQLEENAGAAGVTLGEAELGALRALPTGTVYTQHR